MKVRVNVGVGNTPKTVILTAGDPELRNAFLTFLHAPATVYTFTALFESKKTALQILTYAVMPDNPSPQYSIVANTTVDFKRGQHAMTMDFPVLVTPLDVIDLTFASVSGPPGQFQFIQQSASKIIDEIGGVSVPKIGFATWDAVGSFVMEKPYVVTGTDGTITKEFTHLQDLTVQDIAFDAQGVPTAALYFHAGVTSMKHVDEIPATSMRLQQDSTGGLGGGVGDLRACAVGPLLGGAPMVLGALAVRVFLG